MNARERDRRWAWVGMSAAPMAWLIQEAVCYAVVAQACYPGYAPRETPAFGGWLIPVIGVTILAAAAAVTGGLTAWRHFRQDTDGHGAFLPGEAQHEFLAFAGLLLSGVFLLGILVNLAAVVLLPACG